MKCTSVDRLSGVFRTPYLTNTGSSWPCNPKVRCEDLRLAFTDWMDKFKKIFEGNSCSAGCYEDGFVTKCGLTVQWFPKLKIRTRIKEEDIHTPPDVSGITCEETKKKVLDKWDADKQEYLDWEASLKDMEDNPSAPSEVEYARKMTDYGVRIDCNPSKDCWKALNFLIRLLRVFVVNGNDFLSQSFKITRLDFALDVVGEGINAAMFHTGLKAQKECAWVGSNGIETYYMGASTSAKQWRIYNKALEQKMKGFDWWRIESQTRPRTNEVLTLYTDFSDLWDDIKYAQGDFPLDAPFPITHIGLARMASMGTVPFSSMLKHNLPGRRCAMLRSSVMKVARAYPNASFNPVLEFKDTWEDAMEVIRERFLDVSSICMMDSENAIIQTVSDEYESVYVGDKRYLRRDYEEILEVEKLDKDFDDLKNNSSFDW